MDWDSMTIKQLIKLYHDGEKSEKFVNYLINILIKLKREQIDLLINEINL